ncbi:CGNR zinc finger domain-containing protein [Nocardioides sp.]|jgi:predicted RNA-binding Zn ribbon-like protein|uniref:CGNR zinc finger domain-containing protein n=1 Tax=Nocardioides sp. TaxID=35761 RepID=UPI002F3E40F3
MVFTHDTEAALLAAVALVNSAEEPDTLTTVDELAGFLDEHEFTGTRTGDAAELAAVRALRPRLREVMTRDRDTAAGLVNDLLGEEHALPQLVRHGGHDWHIHAVAPDAPLATRMAVEAAMAMIDVIRGDEMSRLDICADPDCEGIVLDLSRNRSRRFCSTTCTNRAAVAAYRARQR